jgi:hypothetical protein
VSKKVVSPVVDGSVPSYGDIFASQTSDATLDLNDSIVDEKIVDLAPSAMLVRSELPAVLSITVKHPVRQEGNRAHSSRIAELS